MKIYKIIFASLLMLMSVIGCCLYNDYSKGAHNSEYSLLNIEALTDLFENDDNEWPSLTRKALIIREITENIDVVYIGDVIIYYVDQTTTECLENGPLDCHPGIKITYREPERG